MRLVQNADEEQRLGSLWCETPAKAIEVQEAQDRAVAEAAAVSNWDDRNMSPAAKAERETADAASDGHLVEVPRTPVRSHKRGRGRPRKQHKVAAVETAVESTP
jgi:hypothetical protein